MPIPMLVALGAIAVVGLLSTSCEDQKKEAPPAAPPPPESAGSSFHPWVPSSIPNLVPKLVSSALGGTPQIPGPLDTPQKLEQLSRMINFNPGEPAAEVLDQFRAETGDAERAKAFLQSTVYRALMVKTFVGTGNGALQMTLFESVAKAMKEDRGGAGKFVIGAHTSSVGSTEGNQKLSQQWADMVSLILQMYGVPAASLRAVGYGEEFPLVPEIGTASQREVAEMRNRRIEIKPE